MGADTAEILSQIEVGGAFAARLLQEIPRGIFMVSESGLHRPRVIRSGEARQP
jgi:indole-3-glycerol phosphate synthase